MTGFSEYWGAEGVLRCHVCGHEVKCHLWAWGDPRSKGHCNNCGTKGRTTSWVSKNWGPPPHDVVEPEFGKPRVN